MESTVILECCCVCCLWISIKKRRKNRFPPELTEMLVGGCLAWCRTKQDVDVVPIQEHVMCKLLVFCRSFPWFGFYDDASGRIYLPKVEAFAAGLFSKQPHSSCSTQNGALLATIPSQCHCVSPHPPLTPPKWNDYNSKKHETQIPYFIVLSHLRRQSVSIPRIVEIASFICQVRFTCDPDSGGMTFYISIRSRTVTVLLGGAVARCLRFATWFEDVEGNGHPCMLHNRQAAYTALLTHAHHIC